MKRMTKIKIKAAASLLKLKLENKRLKHELAKLRREIVKDHLTGLYNPMAMDSLLKEQVALASRYKLPMSIIMIDFDNLKKYNDKYGHLQGNEAIKTAAIAMRNNIRDSDVLGRWTSGEEFLVILPDTKLEGAIKVAENIRKAIENSRAKATSKDLPPGYQWITVSLGVSQFNGSIKKTLKKADDAMYHAKNLGRNKVIAA